MAYSLDFQIGLESFVIYSGVLYSIQFSVLKD